VILLRSAIKFSGIPACAVRSFSITDYHFSFKYSLHAKQINNSFKLLFQAIGICTRTAFLLSLSKIVLYECSNEAPVRSSLFINTREELSPHRHNANLFPTEVPPSDAVENNDAPSKTRRERFTSTVKSMCPGVSIILNGVFLFYHRCIRRSPKQVTAAEVIVIPRSFSCSINLSWYCLHVLRRFYAKLQYKKERVRSWSSCPRQCAR